jgi:hypothetical protein
MNHGTAGILGYIPGMTEPWLTGRGNEAVTARPN